MEILRTENLTFKYPQSEVCAINNVSININNGEFIVICGESGCGKTTLLKLLKRELAPVGDKSGEIYYNNIKQNNLDKRTSASAIGYVLQNPESQIVTDKVWHELAFGLENLGIQSEIIRRRVGEMASYFGIQGWYRKSTDELSGGQKQLLNLASVMVMQPKILILDEPTSQLDPIAAADFIATLQKLNRELGLTILLTEHRLEDVFPIADRVIVMDKGNIIFDGNPRRAGKSLIGHNMFGGLPSAVRIYNSLSFKGNSPLTVKEGRDFLEENFKPEHSTDNFKYEHNKNVCIDLKDVWFRYDKESEDVLRGIKLKIFSGESYYILGGNGTGKTTALNVIAGLDTAYRGKIKISGKPIKDYKANSLYRGILAYLPQNPQTVFLKESVREDMYSFLEAAEVPSNEHEAMVNSAAKRFGVVELLDKHPYDLSGGEQQKCALAKILLLKPKILLMDEPTKGLDAFSKQGLSNVLNDLKCDGVTIITVTHDVEFAAANADRCALFFDGSILSADIPQRFFAENNFYTTAANRMARNLWKNAVTCEQVIEKCKSR